MGFLKAEMVVEGSTQRKPIIAPFDSFLNEVLKKLAFGTLGKHTTRFLNINVGKNPLLDSTNRCLRNGRETKSRVRLQAEKPRRQYTANAKHDTKATRIGRSPDRIRRTRKD